MYGLALGQAVHGVLNNDHLACSAEGTHLHTIDCEPEPRSIANTHRYLSFGLPDPVLAFLEKVPKDQLPVQMDSQPGCLQYPRLNPDRGAWGGGWGGC